jgi:hypothetical protein
LATVAAIEDFLLPKVKRDSNDIAKEEAEKEKEKEKEKEGEKEKATKEKEKEKPKEKEDDKNKKQPKKKLERAPSKKTDDDAAPKKAKDKKADTDSEKSIEVSYTIPIYAYTYLCLYLFMLTLYKIYLFFININLQGGSSLAGSEDMDFYDDDEYDNYEDEDEEVLPPPGDHPESPDRVHDLKLGKFSYLLPCYYVLSTYVIKDPTGTTPPTHNRFLSSTPTRPIPSSSPLSHTARSLLSSLPPATPPSSVPSPTSSSSTPSTPSQSSSIPLSNYKLAFYVHDQKLPATTTIFQAVQKLTRGI